MQGMIVVVFFSLCFLKPSLNSPEGEAPTTSSSVDLPGFMVNCVLWRLPGIGFENQREFEPPWALE